MNALVIGINGTIGSALFKHLKIAGTPVWGTTHRAIDDHVFYLNLQDDPASWHFPDVHFDVAYLCAGICRMALCEDDPIATQKVNISGMGALAKRLADDGTFIVYLSTNQVFSGEHPFELTNAPHQPTNEYGRQKAEIESYIRTNCPRHAIVRLTKVFEPNISLIQNWINSLTHGQAIKAFHDMPLAPVSLNQVVETLALIGQLQQTDTYHISGSEDVSYHELATYLAQQLKCSIDLVQSVSAIDAGIKKIFLPRFTTLDCSSTIRLGGKTPPHFMDVLAETIT